MQIVGSIFMNMLKLAEESKINPINCQKLKPRSLINVVTVTIFQCALIIFFSGCNDDSDILYATSDELILKFSENKEMPQMYKNKVFQINGEIIEKNQAKDNIPLKNKSVIYFGKRDNNNNFIWNKTIECNFDTLTYDLVNIYDNVIIQGYFKEISSFEGCIVFEKCRFVKPIWEEKE